MLVYKQYNVYYSKKFTGKGGNIMLAKIKYYIVGLVSGIIMASGITYADEIGVTTNNGLLQCSKMVCSIWADGKEIDMDLHILNYEGRSYLPVRKLAEVTGASVTWDGDNRVISVKSATKEVVKEVPKEVIKEIRMLRKLNPKIKWFWGLFIFLNILISLRTSHLLI